ncbi:MAG: efflux RND transporter permease subunit [Planctomycetota bacterium]
MIARIIRFCLEAPAIVFLVVAGLVGGGIFAIQQIPVDAIPDIGEKQIIVYADWPGRSPQNVEDQVTYPLTAGLTGTPGVKTIRSMSGFGFAMVFLVFDDAADYYWCRSRVLERLSVAQANIPEGVEARLGPDATALGQVYMYTIEGEGFDLAELRTIQDWYIRYSLQSVEGVSEVASAGGYLKQYQIDVDPIRMRAANIHFADIDRAVRGTNLDTGAKAIENNGVETFMRGSGFIKSEKDLEETVVRETGGVPLKVKDVATVQFGPDFRRGALDRGGVEAAGGIVTIRYGANPREVIEKVKKRIEQITAGLPQKTLADGSVSKVKIVPFYDRTQLIEETIATLREAVIEELVVVALVVFIFMLHLKTSIAILSTMPIALAIAFLGMWLAGVDANIMSLAGIAIAIGDVADMGIIMAENIFRRLTNAPPGKSRLEVVYEGAVEVGEAIWGAVSNTLICFLPVFALTEEEGRLFRPLAYTKSFAIAASFILAITVVPVACLYLLKAPRIARWKALAIAFAAGSLATVVARGMLPIEWLPKSPLAGWPVSLGVGAMIAFVMYKILSEKLLDTNQNPVSRTIHQLYAPLLRWILNHKALFLTLPVSILLVGITVWLGFDKVSAPVLNILQSAGIDIKNSKPAVALRHAFPGLGREFMPPLDEGSFLFMPSLLPAASLTEGLDVLAIQNRAIRTIPEVENVVGKLGRAETPLDPAPITMIETIIMLKPVHEWRTFPEPRFWESWPELTHGLLRKWFPNVRRMTKDEILAELTQKTEIPGVLPTWLQPIQTRLVMLQTGFRAMMGVKIFGKDLKEIERVAAQMETLLKTVPGAVDVVADRIVGKPYIDIQIDREAIARYGLLIEDVQRVIEQLIGGENVGMTVEGRERYPIRIRYPRGQRGEIDDLEKVLVSTNAGGQIPLSYVAKIDTQLGPSEIKGENGMLVAYVTLNTRGRDEVSVVEDAEKLLQSSVAAGTLQIPAGTHWQWAGQFENQVRSTERLSILIPLCLFLDVVLLYLAFKRWSVAFLCFSAIPVSACGGFIMLLMWDVNISVAVWVGFIALFGVAEDDAVVISTYLQQQFRGKTPGTIAEVRSLVVEAGLKRIRACLMTTATTVIGLIPVFTSTGRGSDVMQPMAIPLVGGMAIQLITLFITPCVYCIIEEWRLKRRLAGTP